MNKPREERLKEYYMLSDMKAEAEKVLLKIPGVIDVGIGLKVSEGLPTEHVCFRVYVEAKKATGELGPKEMIPAEINGIKTDVNELPWGLSASDDDEKYRPLCGGIQIASSGDAVYDSGTLGCFALDLDVTPNEVVMLTNYHVLMLTNETQGHPIAQPDFCCDDCPCRCGEVAKLKRGSFNNVDCAIAGLSNGHQDTWTNEIPGLGAITGIPLNSSYVPVNPDTGTTTATGDPTRPYIPFVHGDRVFKRGKRTGVTEGIIIQATSNPFNIVYDSKAGPLTRPYRDQIWIEPLPGGKPFSGKGDSGSVILNELNQVIGLFFSDNENQPPGAPATISWANPIQDVCKELHIKIPDTGTLLTMPARAISHERNGRHAIDALETRIVAYAHGKTLLGVFKKNRKEVMQLINHNREVMVAWNRYGGPSFVANLLEKERNPDHIVTEEINGISWMRLLSKMSVVLEQNGSPEFAADIAVYSTKIFGLVRNIFKSYNSRTVVGEYGNNFSHSLPV